MSFSDTSYFQVPEDNECILNAVQLGKLIDEPATTIRSWADKHDKYLYIKKVNDRFVYTQASVEQFKFIKDLCRNKNFTHKQITDHIKQHGFEYSKYDSGLVDIKDPLGYQALASALALENQKQLKEFLTNFIQYQEQNNEELVKSVRIEVSQTVQDQIEESMNGIEKELQEQKEENKKLSQQLEQVHNELAIAKDINIQSSEILQQKMQDNFDNMNNKNIDRDVKLVDDLLKRMEITKAKNKEAEEQSQPKSFLDKLFHKKK